MKKKAALFATVLCVSMTMSHVCVGEAARKPMDGHGSIPRVKVKIKSMRMMSGVVVQDIEYSSDGMLRNVGAYLVAPERKGLFPAIMYLHMYPNHSKEQFLDEAIRLSAKGAVCLLVEGSYPWKERPKNAVRDRKMIMRQVSELQSGVDLLLSREDVDIKRIAFVGMDYGAMNGMVFAGSEKRISYFVFIAGATRFHKWNWYFTGEALLPEYASGLSDCDPISMISRWTAERILLQYSEKDEWVSAEDAMSIFDAIKGCKDIEWYDSGHDGMGKVSEESRVKWLTRVLSMN